MTSEEDYKATIQRREALARLSVDVAIDEAIRIVETKFDSPSQEAIVAIAALLLREETSYSIDDRLSDIQTAIEMSA